MTNPSSRKRLIIVGAGGFGRECQAWAKQIPEDRRDWDLYGFIDDHAEALNGYSSPFPILDAIENYNPRPDDLFLLAIGNPRPKLAVAEKLSARGANFLTFIHPTACIGDNVRMGVGCVICPYVVLTCDIHLGDFVTCNAHSSVGHDAVIGDGSTLSPHADVTGFARLGTGVFMGSHAAALPRSRIGNFATIGAGSVALVVREGITVFGVPGKKIG